MTNQARAALMRLRDRFVEGRNQVAILANTADPKTPLDGAVSTIDMVVLPEIDRELAALPADEMSPPFEGDPKDCAFKPRTSSALVEAVKRMVDDDHDGYANGVPDYIMDPIIAALAAERSRPADEAAGLVEAAQRALVHLEVGLPLRKESLTSAVEWLRDGLKAERARKPQPADRAVEALRGLAEAARAHLEVWDHAIRNDWVASDLRAHKAAAESLREMALRAAAVAEAEAPNIEGGE